MRAKKGKPNKSWVETSIENFKYFIGADFVDQLEMKLDFQGLSQRTFAEKLGVTEGRVSQIINNPGNLTLDTMVSWAQTAGMKTGVFLYDDVTDGVSTGPLSGQIFVECWKRMGSPRAMIFGDNANVVSGSVSCSNGNWQREIQNGLESKASLGDAVFANHFGPRQMVIQSSLQRQYSKEMTCGFLV